MKKILTPFMIKKKIKITRILKVKRKKLKVEMPEKSQCNFKIVHKDLEKIKEFGRHFNMKTTKPKRVHKKTHFWSLKEDHVTYFRATECLSCWDFSRQQHKAGERPGGRTSPSIWVRRQRCSKKPLCHPL